MLIDPNKLKVIRQPVDEEVVARMCQDERHTISGVIDAIGHELGYRVCRFRIDEWYVVTWQVKEAIDEIDLYHENGDFDRAADVDIESRIGHIAIAARLDLALIAALCRMLDAEADVYMDDDCRSEVYPENGASIQSSVGCALFEYIRQELWLGAVPQTGHVADLHSIYEICGTKEYRIEGLGLL